MPRRKSETKKWWMPPPPDEMNILLRLFITMLVVIIGFNFARSRFFEEYPLFGVDYLAESLIAALATLLGFFTIPSILLGAKNWLEQLIVKTVQDIVVNFWDQQSQRMQDARRDRQRQRSKARAQKQKEDVKNGILLDTSMLIDGRVLDLVKVGFISNVLIVPEKVTDELHALSDSKNSLKRQKGRRGLDVLAALKKQAKVVSPVIKGKKTDVDKALVRFAKNNKVKLMTLDFNLMKVADVAGVKILNLNELVNALKTVLLPGEEVEVKIIQVGKERKQGVGYLDDGTMIVIENAKDRVDQVVKAKVSKVIQSPAGKIIFAK
ncbi:TRAM domain-containing protein [bacterium]|nr:TRAM domain-containing protein [bacterium]